jgi:hypothetical protein
MIAKLLFQLRNPRHEHELVQYGYKTQSRILLNLHPLKPLEYSPNRAPNLPLTKHKLHLATTLQCRHMTTNTHLTRVPAPPPQAYTSTALPRHQTPSKSTIHPAQTQPRASIPRRTLHTTTTGRLCMYIATRAPL